MLIIGAILLIAGTAGLIYGITQNNSVTAQWSALLSSGSANPGTIYIIIGVIVAIIGLVLLVLGLLNRTRSK